MSSDESLRALRKPLTITLDGNRIAYRLAGNGPVLLLVHGMAGATQMSEVTTTDGVEIFYNDWGVSTLVMHGGDDQIVPIAASAMRSAKLLRSGTLTVYEKFPHGMCTTHAEVINPDLYAFVRAGA